MLWSLLKVVVFLAIAVALAFGAAWILEKPGEVSIAFAGREFALTPIGFVISLALFLVAALIVLKIIGFLGAVVRFLLGDETAISRYFSRSRERRGFDALSDGMVALAEGDPRLATRKAAKAEKLLRRPDVTRLVSAQAAELSGDQRKAQDYYKSMLENDRTRFVGVKGLMHQKLEAGETDTALELAKKAFALRPQNPALLRTLFELQSSRADWSGARKTLNASMTARMLPRDVGTRRDAVLSLADARAAFAEGNATRGAEAALQANKLAPTLVPAAALGRRGAYGEGVEAAGDQGSDRRLERQSAPRSRGRLRGDSARRDAGGATQALRDPDRRGAAGPREPAARDRTGAGRGGFSRGAQGSGRSGGHRTDHAQPRADGCDRTRPGRERGCRARLARQGPQRLSRAAMDLREMQPRPCGLGSGL